MIAGVVLLAGGAAVGLFGSLLGLGGGILLVPLLTLGFGRPLREAVAISLVSVIVTSSAGAASTCASTSRTCASGMVLELFTACGALVGGLIAFALPVPVLEGLFAAAPRVRGVQHAPAPATCPPRPSRSHAADDVLVPRRPTRRSSLTRLPSRPPRRSLPQRRPRRLRPRACPGLATP